MTQENRRRNSLLEQERGWKSLSAAKVLLDQGFPEDSISRASAAAFHFARALLMEEGIQAKSHSGVRSQVSLHFVMSGRLKPEEVGKLARLQGLRELSDYDSAAVFNAEMAREALEEAEGFCRAVQEMLSSNPRGLEQARTGRLKIPES